MVNKSILNKLEKFKYPALILVVGLFLLALPFGSKGGKTGQQQDLLLQEALSQSEGVGQALVLVSEKGVIVICDGAKDPQTRLDILRAIGSYTGFGSDKITILQLAEQP